MSRTLEIQLYGMEYEFFIGQLENVDVEDVEDIHFSDIEKLSEITGYEIEEPENTISLPSISSCYFGNITIKNDDTIEYIIENDSINIDDIYKSKYQKFLYWGKKDKNNTDMQLIELNGKMITYVGYYENKSSWLVTLNNFEGKFDKNLVTVIVNLPPRPQYKYWPNDGKFLGSIYYKDKLMEMEFLAGNGKGSETIYWDKGWNSTTPVLYNMLAPDILK